MINTYYEVLGKAYSALYQFIKLYDISTKEYSYHDFFTFQTEQNQIEVLTHHFRNNSVSGLFINNKEGISISYEKSHPTTRQNFTKCHELGHFMLKHSGGYFTENNVNNNELEDLKEIEANFYSAFILMPDIVLLQKIGYENKTFNSVMFELEVSQEALHNKLMDTLQYKCNLNRKLALNIVMNYRKGNNHAILKYLSLIKENIISEYYQIQYSPEEKLLKLMKEKNFISNFDMKELNDDEFKQQIKNKFNHIGAWGYYDKGKSISYAFDKNKLADKQALQKAKTILILKH
ncbi:MULTISPECIES: ImmA/IrrE family metallo-endopeptidase [unclassified Enterococcus]|uniref:ImmA/IrrE family metallo-endopeptidase n=1 Tax=unclassified Enterococcus TaxID=2608891 RepID=UPI001554665B|nr:MULTISPECIES: ImmA/IrrE family metallo-endopeptidase [unclassified Enterococcus]MBS7576949.1 ImmA/IrrE family metallo-endopeptidase [Enterococcus sp. MMGLQ5-2]MBS7584356.1 ImmA/IrrE family metallo-endopeptidase [Enterococcus sp. MMGLQ5-1]NPD12211.1 ImmA/IrrE family metallo-endopeptidase [Enterococcus sp. MMGLQ5-1]NPD36783.1 ImmA/IrrE family metallo-endopeptidase [Enterococcus sp. MMGLQ5-2]